MSRNSFTDQHADQPARNVAGITNNIDRLVLTKERYKIVTQSLCKVSHIKRDKSTTGGVSRSGVVYKHSGSYDNYAPHNDDSQCFKIKCLRNLHCICTQLNGCNGEHTNSDDLDMLGKQESVNSLTKSVPALSLGNLSGRTTISTSDTHKSHLQHTAECITCKHVFHMYAKQVSWFLSKKFDIPKSCPSCRSARKERIKKVPHKSNIDKGLEQLAQQGVSAPGKYNSSIKAKKNLDVDKLSTTSLALSPITTSNCSPSHIHVHTSERRITDFFKPIKKIHLDATSGGSLDTQPPPELLFEDSGPEPSNDGGDDGPSEPELDLGMRQVCLYQRHERKIDYTITTETLMKTLGMALFLALAGRKVRNAKVLAGSLGVAALPLVGYVFERYIRPLKVQKDIFLRYFGLPVRTPLPMKADIEVRLRDDGLNTHFGVSEFIGSRRVMILEALRKELWLKRSTGNGVSRDYHKWCAQTIKSVPGFENAYRLGHITEVDVANTISYFVQELQLMEEEQSECSIVRAPRVMTQAQLN